MLKKGVVREAHSNLGIALKKQGKFPDAVSSYQRALQIKPNYAEAHYNLGITYLWTPRIALIRPNPMLLSIRLHKYIKNVKSASKGCVTDE